MYPLLECDWDLTVWSGRFVTCGGTTWNKVTLTNLCHFHKSSFGFLKVHWTNVIQCCAIANNNYIYVNTGYT